MKVKCSRTVFLAMLESIAQTPPGETAGHNKYMLIHAENFDILRLTTADETAVSAIIPDAIIKEEGVAVVATEHLFHALRQPLADDIYVHTDGDWVFIHNGPRMYACAASDAPQLLAKYASRTDKDSLLER